MDERDLMAAALFTCLAERVIKHAAEDTLFRYLPESGDSDLKANLSAAARLSLMAADIFRDELKREATGATDERADRRDELPPVGGQ